MYNISVNHIYFMSIGASPVCVCVYIQHMCSAHRGQMREVGSPGTQVSEFVVYRVGTGN